MERFIIRLFVIMALAVIAACADRETFYLSPAPQSGTILPIFTITNRGDEGEDGFDQTRAHQVTYLREDVSVPPDREAGELLYGRKNANPQKDFVTVAQKEYPSRTDFEKALKSQLAQLPPTDREVALFVHGYNTSHSEAVYRMAQMQYDMETSGVSAVFSWPSAANVFGYAYDQDSMIYSRDALEETLHSLSKVASGRTLLVAHSMGTMLAMEALRQMEIAQPGWAQKHLSGVVLISPDIDIDVFKGQLDRMPNLPQPFVVFVSRKDRVLELSGIINGRLKRLGHESDIEALKEYPVLVIDITEFGDVSFGGHFTLGSSPELMAYLNSPAMQEAVIDSMMDGGTVTVSGQLVSNTIKQAENAIQWILFPTPEKG